MCLTPSSRCAATRASSPLEDLLLSTVNVFHRAATQVRDRLDRNEDEQKRTQGEQDGSEVRSVDLEQLIAEGVTMIERRSAMDVFLDDPPTYSKRISELPGSFELVLAPTTAILPRLLSTAGSSSRRSIRPRSSR
jgi:hypothetical protein